MKGSVWAAIRSRRWMVHEPFLRDLRAATIGLPMPVRKAYDDYGDDPSMAMDSESDRPRHCFELLEDGVALIRVQGMIYAYDTYLNDVLCDVLGGTITPRLVRSVRYAMESPEVRGVMLSVDSGGGEADGVSEAAYLIRKLSDKKPLVAYTAGWCASAGYHLACAAPWILAHPSAMVGCIGVKAIFEDDSKMLEEIGIKEYEYVSVQSPRKSPKPGTTEGDAQIQEWVDASADVFIADVALFRRVSAQKVVNDFGQGDMLIGSEAQRVGMVDDLGDFDAALAFLKARIDASETVPAEPNPYTVFPGVTGPVTGASGQSARGTVIPRTAGLVPASTIGAI